MASITLRKLEDSLKSDLRRQAADNGRSLEAEARALLKAGVKGRAAREETGAELFDRIHRRFKDLGGIELNLPVRGPSRNRIPDFTRGDLGWPEKK
jgi:antitoxin FitA